MMGAGRLLLVCLILCLFVSACGPQPPQYRDPLADLASTTGATVPTDLSVKAGPTVALTLGSNVERFLKYHDDGNAYAASVGANKALLEEGNPQYLVNGSIDILKRRYPRIKSVESLTSAGAHGRQR